MINYQNSHIICKVLISEPIIHQFEYSIKIKYKRGIYLLYRFYQNTKVKVNAVLCTFAYFTDYVYTDIQNSDPYCLIYVCLTQLLPEFLFQPPGPMGAPSPSTPSWRAGCLSQVSRPRGRPPSPPRLGSCWLGRRQPGQVARRAQAGNSQRRQPAPTQQRDNIISCWANQQQVAWRQTNTQPWRVRRVRRVWAWWG